tara:strand:+ start:5745 stop:6356 length:612 start_codon:yes stop_codon:yes gene_type:complete
MKCVNLPNNLILSAIHSPFNIHFMNIINNSNNLFENDDQQSRFYDDIKLSTIQKKLTIVKNIELSETIIHSDSFLIISSFIQNIINNIYKFNQNNHDDSFKFNDILNCFIDILHSFNNSTEDNGLQLTQQLLILENIIENIPSNIFFEDDTKDEYNIQLKYIIEISSSLYGIFSLIQPQFTWNDIIANKMDFDTIIDNIQIQN